MKRRVVSPWIALALGLVVAASSAQAQFNPQGRGKKPKAGSTAPRGTPRVKAPEARANEGPPSSAPVSPAPASAPGSDALIARYTAVALSQPGVEFPVQRLSELYRARDGKLDALIADLSARASKPGPERFAALLALAQAYLQDGRGELSVATYERAVAEAPTSAVAELGLARLQAQRGERAAAKAHYERALSLVKEATDREQVLRALITLSLDSNDVPSARKYHEELVRRQAGSFFVKAELGRELYSRGLYPEAVEELAKVVKAGAGDNRVLAPALRDYGRALAKTGRSREALRELERALSVAGAQAGVRREIYESIVELYRAENRLADLIQDLERRGGRDADAERLLASLYEETGKLEKALVGFRRALGRDPKDIATRLKVVHILEVQGQLEEAIRDYEALAHAAPRNPDFVFRLADALIQRGDRKRALEKLRALEGRSEDEEVLTALVSYYERIGEKAKSLTLLQRLSARGGSDPEHLVELGSRYFEAGDKKKAVATWQRIRAVAKDRAEGLRMLGELYLEHDMVREALETLEEAVRLEPKQLRLRKAHAMALERAGTASSSRDSRQLYHDQALKIWEQILRDNTKSADLSREARQHIVTLWSLSGTLAPRTAALSRRLDATPPDLDAGRLLAEAEMRLRRYPEAERTLRKIAKKAPGDIESLTWLERVLGLQRKLGDAILVLETLARAEPKRAREYYQRMAEYAAELYRDEDAIRYASRAVELAPEDAEGHKKLGEMYRKRGDIDRAVSELRQAISKNERLFPVYFDLAELLLGQGKSEEADLLLRRVVRAAPDEELITRAARLSLQVNLGRGLVENLERDLLPLALDNPERPIYRRLLVELYGALAYPLLHRANAVDPAEAREAEEQLRRLGERAVKPLLDALSDTRDTQQETATTLLMHVASRSAGPALLAYAMGNAAPRLRARAMVAVGALADPALVPRLSELVAPGGHARAEEADPVLVAAAWALARSGTPAARAPLLALTEGPSSALRALGVVGLGLLHDRASGPAIVRALAATDAGPLPRAAAAFAVGELGLGQRASELAELVDAPDPLLASSALVALSRVGGKATPELIARALLASDRELRPAARAAALVWATSAYRRRGVPLPIPSGELDLSSVLSGLLPDAYSAADERLALGRLGPSLESAAQAAARSGPEGARAVADALARDGGAPFSTLLVLARKDPGARGEAELLAERIAEKTVPAFVALAEHPTAEVRTFALGFLARRKEPLAVAAVVRALGDPDSGVQRAVLAGLSPLHAGAADALSRLSESQEWSLRAAAVEGLGRVVRSGGPEVAVRALERAAEKDGTALVREAALRVLARSVPEVARRALARARDSDAEPHVRSTAEALLRSSR